MAFGTAPFASREFDDLVSRRIQERKRLRNLLASPEVSGPDTVLRADPLAPGPIETPAEPVPSAPEAPTVARPSGRVGLDAALRAGGRERDFFGGLLQGFGAAGEASRAAQATATAQEQARDDRERQFGLDERRVAADELRASRAPVPRTPSETTAEELAATLEFLQRAGASPDEIKTYFLTKGRSSSGGDLSDLDNLARSYVETGRARTLAEGYILARRESANPQAVGFIRRTIYDPKSLNFTTVNASVFRRFNPLTGGFDVMDQYGNVLTEADRAQIQTDPNAFSGGTGGVTPPVGGAVPQGAADQGPPPLLQRIMSPERGFNLPPEALPGLRPGPVPLGGRQPGNRPSWLNYVKPGG